MKRLIALMLVALMTLSAVSGAAEGLSVEYDWTGERAVSSEENGDQAADGDDVAAENVEPVVDEAEEAPLSEPDAQIGVNGEDAAWGNDEAASKSEGRFSVWFHTENRPSDFGGCQVSSARSASCTCPFVASRLPVFRPSSPSSQPVKRPPASVRIT